MTATSLASATASPVLGLHHITLVTSNEQLNRRFYTEVLGLRRVKLSVNQDDVFHRHLFYADDPAKGNAITFFEWPELPRGMVGLGSPHHLSYDVTSIEALVRWKGWLSKNGVPSSSLIPRGDRFSLYLRDPDGVFVEITAKNTEKVSQGYIFEMDSGGVNRIDAEMKLTGFNHASPISRDPDATSRFLGKALGLRQSYFSPNPDEAGGSVLGLGVDSRPEFLRYLTGDRPPMGFVGVGNIHHIAMAVADDDEQKKVLQTLDRVGVRNSGIIDRFWFHSVYFRDPDGNLLEVATKTPGYTADESPEAVGSRLVLPPWLETRRSEIQSALEMEDRANPLRWPPTRYPDLPQPPEKLSVAIA